MVEATAMRDALCAVPGVRRATLEPDADGPTVLRIRLAPDADQDEVVGAALAGLRSAGARVDLGPGGGRLRLVGPDGRAVVAVVEASSSDLPELVVEPARRAAHRRDDGRPSPGPSSSPPRAVRHPGLVPAVPVVPEEPARLVLERVEVATERLQLWATVRLARGELRFSGTAGASASGPGAHRAVAAATARAAESALGDAVRLDVEAVDVLTVGQDRIGVVIVTLLTERGLDRLTGAALVRGDGHETIVRATLAALNRRAESRGLERHAPRA